MYDAYKWSVMNNNENLIQAQLNNSLHLVAHTIAQTNSRNPQPYKGSANDFMFRGQVDARKEAEKWLKE